MRRIGGLTEFVKLAEKEVIKLRNENDDIITDCGKILKETEMFYANLYKGKITNENIMKENRIPEKAIRNINFENIPDIELEEVENAIRQIKKQQSPRRRQYTSRNV